MSAHDLFFIPQPKPRSNTRKVWNIKETVSALGPEICTNILFLDAILGCDTTSALHGIGKGQALKKIKMDAVFRKQPSVFSNKEASKTDILAAGEKALVCLYKGRSNESLHLLRYTRFCQKVASGKSCVKPEGLPRTCSAAGYHSLRVFHQVQQWKGVALPPQDWGWRLADGRLVPQRTDLPAAHASLLEIVRCRCKSDCSSQKCTRRKHGLECSAACGSCIGQSCANSAQPDLDE